MKVLRNGQQVEFSLCASGALVQETVFHSQAGVEMPVKDFLLPLGEDDKIIVMASNLGLARQMVRMHVAEQEAAAAQVVEDEDASLIQKLTDPILDTLRDFAHGERRNLVNLYVGDDRSEKIVAIDKAIGLIEEEQARRSGLMSGEDILAGLRSENLTLSVYEATALPQPENSAYEVGQRIICVNLPRIGATVRSLDDSGVGVDYDNDDAEERGTHEALFSAIRPMPHH